jgi:hypothetical protein
MGSATKGERGQPHMLSLIYVSRVGSRFDPESLDALAADAARRNAGSAVTGLLLCNGRHFMQLLEGEEMAVRATMSRIAQDSRHHELVVIREDERRERECPDWAMRACTSPLTGAGAATEFAAALPIAMQADTRVLMTSFASALKAEMA